MTVALVTKGIIKKSEIIEIDKYTVVGGTATAELKKYETTVSLDKYQITVRRCAGS